MQMSSVFDRILGIHRTTLLVIAVAITFGSFSVYKALGGGSTKVAGTFQVPSATAGRTERSEVPAIAALGTAIFTKPKPLAVLNDFADHIRDTHGLADDGYGDPLKEGRVISAEYEKFHVGTSYIPNANRDLSRLGPREKNW